MTTSLVWFRRDLRVHDNPTLAAAANANTVVPVYCFAPSQYSTTMFDIDKIGAYRAQFIRESVQGLRRSLGGLITLHEEPSKAIPRLVDEYDVDTVHYQSLPGTEERSTERSVRDALDTADVSQHWTHTLYHIQDLPTTYLNMHDTFTPWRKQTEQQASVRSTVDTPAVSVVDAATEASMPSRQELGVAEPTYDDRSVLPFEGGEETALDRAEQYIWDEDRLREYKETRNGLLGQGYSSKFSPWLAQGCLSPRWVYEQVQQYEDERVANDSTYWLVFELMWRDFFQFQLRKHGAAFFGKTGIRDVERTWAGDEELFNRWAAGETGIPFVDANMRELNETGFMSNRGRQNVASFLTDVLDVDWRRGAAYFESMLVDYDVASNWGNWAYQAGVGNDSRDGRYFNVVKQGERYDATGEYIREWLPELSALPASATHRPWELSERQQTAYGVPLGDVYPEPVVDVEAVYERLASDRNA